MPTISSALATHTQGESLLADLAPYLLMLTGIVVVGIVTTGIIRRKLLQRQHDESGMPFTLDDLRQLHQDGQLSDEEFSQASAQMIEALTTGHKTPLEDSNSEK